MHALIDTDKEVGWALADANEEAQADVGAGVAAGAAGVGAAAVGASASVPSPSVVSPSGVPVVSASSPPASVRSALLAAAVVNGASPRLSHMSLPADFISSRHFNVIQEMGNTIIKSALTESIRGELFYYQHIPPQVRDLFPALHRIDVGHVRVAQSEAVLASGPSGSPGSLSNALSSSDSASSGTISSLVIERIRGVSFSHLLINRCLTDGRLQKLLTALQRLHQVQSKPARSYTPPPHADDSQRRQLEELVLEDETAGDVNIFANYSAKMGARFQQWAAGYAALDAHIRTEEAHAAFSILSSSVSSSSSAGSSTSDPSFALSSADLCAALMSHLREYECQGRGVYAHMIHGDPVFSNVLLTSDSAVVLLDMRGSLGSKRTTAGDMHYDLAKVLQSLYGYDLILLNKTERMSAAPFSLDAAEDTMPLAQMTVVAHSGATPGPMATGLMSPLGPSNSGDGTSSWPAPGQSQAHSSAESSDTQIKSLDQAQSVPPVQCTSGQARYLRHLRSVFWSFVRLSYPSVSPVDLRVSVAALYFSLIPLHQKVAHQVQFLKLAKWMWHNRHVDEKP